MRSVEAVLSLLALVSACASDADSTTASSAISWAIDPSCSAPADWDVRAIEDAAAIWGDGFGVQIVQDDPAADSSVLVCFRDQDVVGLGDELVMGTTHREGDRYHIEVNRRPVRFYRAKYAALLAHEFGHVVLPGSADEDHLAAGQHGIMSSSFTCVDAACKWSDADIDMIEHTLGI
jgi:hypothetical protein